MKPATSPSRRRLFAMLGPWLACTVLLGAPAQDATRALPSPTPGWPQWRGPHRDGVSMEKGLLQKWPEGGPKKLWAINGIGKGFGSPAIVGDTIYIAGDVGEELVVLALDWAGKVKWRTTNGKSWKKSHPGGRPTCCFDDGKLYLVNAHGRLACLNAADGAELWAVNILEDFGGKNITWGVSESVLVDGDMVFATPVGTKALMVALDKRNGRTLWATPPIPGEELSYASAILASVAGRKQLITSSARQVFGVDAKSGEMLWQQAHVIPKKVIGMSPVFHRDSVFVGSATKDIGRAFRLKITGKQPEVIWTAPLGETYAGNVVCVDGEVVGAQKSKLKQWLLIDAENGEIKHTEKGMDGGSVIHADNRFYCLTDRGLIRLLKSTKQGFETMGQMQAIKKRNVWSHPVICNGRLYLRYHDTLHCFDIRR